MKSVSKRVLAALSVTAVSVVGLGSAQAATTDHQVRPTDLFTTHSEANGSYDFLKEGVHLQTKDGDAYAKGYFKVTPIDLKNVHDVSFEWFGSGYGTSSGVGGQTEGQSTGSPGIYYNVDVDGDNHPDGQLIGEAAYGGQDVWLNRDSQDGGFDGTQTTPDDYFKKAAPSCTDGESCTGGSGAPEHGTLDAWAAKILSKYCKTARVISSGFLANGLVENGVLRSISLGDDSYVFTDEESPVEPTPVDVTGKVDSTLSKGALGAVTLVSDKTPEGSTEGKKITWEITTGSTKTGAAQTVRMRDTMGAGEKLQWNYTFAAAGGNQRVTVLKNGKSVATFVVKP